MLTAAHHAWLAAATRSNDPAGILVDYLQEHDATLPEVLVLYAGTPPEHADGLPHEALWTWLQRTEPQRWCHIVRDGHVNLWRWEAVRDTRPDMDVFCRVAMSDADFRHVEAGISCEAPRDDSAEQLYQRNPAARDLAQRASAAAARDRKRRVLALFLEVQVEQESYIRRCSWDTTSGIIKVSTLQALQAETTRLTRHYHMRNGRHIIFSQVERQVGTSAAPDLIPPEQNCINVPIFRAGTYRGITWTAGDLDRIAANFEANRDVLVPVVASGAAQAEDDTGLHLGHVSHLRRGMDMLHADVVGAAVPSGRHFSVEIYDQPPEGLLGHGPMLRRVVLLTAGERAMWADRP